jgi:hypothetical protein
VYDREGLGVVTRDELHSYFMASLHANEAAGERRGGDGSSGRGSGAAEAAVHAGVSNETTEMLRTFSDCVFDAVDSDKLGKLTRAEVIAHVSSRPELQDVAAVFGRAMLPPQGTDIMQVLHDHYKDAAGGAAAASYEEWLRPKPRRSHAERSAFFDALATGMRGLAPFAATTHNNNNDNDDIDNSNGGHNRSTMRAAAVAAATPHARRQHVPRPWPLRVVEGGGGASAGATQTNATVSVRGAAGGGIAAASSGDSDAAPAITQ